MWFGVMALALLRYQNCREVNKCDTLLGEPLRIVLGFPIEVLHVFHRRAES
jgi:hypothetical protein